MIDQVKYIEVQSIIDGFLEAFGNAKIVKNNKSRFLTQRGNYHCFYMLCAAPVEMSRSTSWLTQEHRFHYLNLTNCYEAANVNDAREYPETRNAMDVVGIAQEEHVLTKKNGSIQFKSGDRTASFSHFSDQMQLRTVSMRRPHHPLSVR